MGESSRKSSEGESREVQRGSELTSSFCFQPKIFLPSLLFLIVLLGLSIGIPMATKRKDTPEDSTFKPTSPEPTTPDSSEPPPATDPITVPSTAPTTTPETPKEFQIVIKSEWQDKGLNLEGKFKQISKVKRIIVTSTLVEQCSDKVNFMKSTR
jgi:hypothetical protein